MNRFVPAALRGTQKSTGREGECVTYQRQCKGDHVSNTHVVLATPTPCRTYQWSFARSSCV